MSIKIPQTTFEAVPTGEYHARIDSIADETGQYGDQLKFKFALIDEFEGRALTGYTTQIFSQNSKLYAWNKAALGGGPIPPNSPFDSDDLIGKEVVLVVVRKQGDNGYFNRIEDVKPYLPDQDEPFSAPSEPIPF